MSAAAKPRPSITLLALSTIVVGLCCVFLGGSLALVFQSFDACELFSALLVLPWPLWLGAAQYLAVSRGHIRASRQAQVIAVVFGSLLVPGTIILTTAMLSSDFDTGSLAILTVLLALIAVLLSSAELTRRWERRLLAGNSPQLHISAVPPARGHWQISLRETFVLLSMCSVVLASGVYVSRSLKPRWAEHVQAAESPLPLPAEASDVTYNESLRNGYFCEFTCSEVNFRRWIETGEMRFGRKGAIQEIQGERRHQRLSLAPFRRHPPDVTVTNGLEFTYGDVAKDGFVVRVIYDRDTHRAYYSRMND